MNVALVGFMGSGKSAVAASLGRLLDRPVVDTDAWIEARAGRSIPDIFAACGEQAFRRRERDCIRRVSRFNDVIIATGGGTWMDPQNRHRLRANAASIYLAVPEDTLLDRLAEVQDRPLLYGGDRSDRVRALLAERIPVYEGADHKVDTRGKGPEEIAREIIRRIPGSVGVEEARPAVESVDIHSGEPYRVVIGAGLSEAPGEHLAAADIPPRPLFLGTDTTVDMLYAGRWCRALEQGGYSAEKHVVADAETSKRLAVASDALDAFFSSRPDRGTPIVALGGGVVGDLFGFVAAIALRGVPFIGVPTTLLAQVDSSVGGKVAVNHLSGKNLVGAFHQPRLVLADTATLRTLPQSTFVDGMAEVIKHGLLEGGEYLQFLRSESEAIRRRELAALQRVVVGSCRIKAQYVGEDEREHGIRAHLNLGHTAAHAVETVSGGAISHGWAVGYGLRIAARLSHRRGMLKARGLYEIEDLLDAWGFARSLAAFDVCLDPTAVISAMHMDKKRRDGVLRWVLLGDVGYPVVSGDVTHADIAAALEEV